MSVRLRRRTVRRRVAGARSPQSVPGLLAWGRADDAALVGEGNTVESIPDRVNGGAYVNSTTSQRPRYRGAGLSGRAALAFDAANAQRLVGPSVTVPTGTWTLWVVASRTSGTSAAAAINLDSGTGATRIAQVGWASDTVPRAVGFPPDLSALVDAGPALALGAPAVLLAVGSGVTMQSWANGASDGATSGSAQAVRGGTRTLDVGRTAASGPAYLTGLVAEWGVYDHALTAAERATLHSYVQDYYGITVADYAAA